MLSVKLIAGVFIIGALITLIAFDNTKISMALLLVGLLFNFAYERRVVRRRE